MVRTIDLVGPRLQIRRARLEDAEHSFRWFADARVTEYLPLAGERELPLEQVRAFLEVASRSDHPDLAVGIDLRDGRSIGCGGFRHFVGDSAEVSIVIGEPESWGQGYGREPLTLLLDFGFDELGLSAIWLMVRTDNVRAVALFTALGFVVTETLLACVVARGVPRDKYRMTLAR